MVFTMALFVKAHYKFRFVGQFILRDVGATIGRPPLQTKAYYGRAMLAPTNRLLQNCLSNRNLTG